MTEKRGRPSSYTPEIAHEILRRIAEGESLRAICREDGFPPASTVRGWVLDDVNGFSEHYVRARQLQAEYWAEEILEITDDGTNDWMEKHDKDGNNIGWQLNGEHVQRSRLRTDTRKWLLSKVLPKVYGDKIDVTSAGKQVGFAINIDVDDKPSDKL
jgi:hypothetical protein